MEAQRCAVSPADSAHLRSELTHTGYRLGAGKHGLVPNCGKTLLSFHVLESKQRSATSVWDTAGQAAGYQNIRLQRAEVRKQWPAPL